MRSLVLLGIDATLIVLATIMAVALRYNFEFPFDRTSTVAVYVAASLLASCIVLPAAGLNRSIWRFSSLPDYMRIMGAVTAITLIAVALMFAGNRLDGVARSLPFIQFLLAAAFLIGARVLYRTHHLRRQARGKASAPLRIVQKEAGETILVVGLSRLTEMYLQSLAELAGDRVHVAGLLGLRNRHVGRLAASYPILGLADDVERVLQDLELHGTAIDRIVVTTTLSALSPAARAALLRIESGTPTRLEFLTENLGLEDGDRLPSKTAAQPAEPSVHAGVSFVITPSETIELAGRHYWKIKRTGDVALSATLLILLAPVLLVVAFLVGTTIGFPVLFWQRRPGLGGRPFHVYKFRTLSADRDSAGRVRSDEERMSRIGSFLRRTRLDELPQLVSILRGDMSFIGPRPLLPRDQSDAYRARLLVRPGLTGWAQVIGGRSISPSDKAALDVWYVKNASLWLDASIVLRTIPMVLFGERISQDAIVRAWRDLQAGGAVHRSTANDQNLDGARPAA